jgi:hypothetical protein
MTKSKEFETKLRNSRNAKKIIVKANVFKRIKKMKK